MPDEPSARDLGYLSIVEAGNRIATGALSPVTLATALLERITLTDVALNAFVRVMPESALAEAEVAAERARDGHRLGPLDGIPVAVKDLYDTAGVVTAGGTGAYRERVPTADATAVRRLREAGAVVLGKTNTHELALGGTTTNVHYGATHNPWRLDRVPGGSSGGSAAALAGGQALGALGTDTGGSIRLPAAFCAVTGHKPTYGLVGRGGVIPLSLTLDHAGPMARSVEDCALLLNALAGPDPGDHDSDAREREDYAATLDRGVEGLRLAVVPSLVEGCREEVAEAFERALDTLRTLGATIERVEPMAGADRWRSEVAPIIVVEGASHIEPILRSRPQSIGESVRERMARGLDVPATAYARALEVRKEIEARYQRPLAGGLDAYVLPTSPVTAEPIGEEIYTQALPSPKFRNTSVFDYSRQPSVSVPCGFDRDGLPIGLMVSAARFRDAHALRIAHAYQRATDFHLRTPEF